VLDLSTLTDYVSYARKYIHPQLSDEAAEELTRGYVEIRKRGNFPGSSKKVMLLLRNHFILCNSVYLLHGTNFYSLKYYSIANQSV